MLGLTELKERRHVDLGRETHPVVVVEEALSGRLDRADMGVGTVPGLVRDE
jgi:hypothetical protein